MDNNNNNMDDNNNNMDDNKDEIVDNESFFKEIDKKFININSITDDSFVYKASDVLVQSSWELPIVVQYPDSTIEFEFTTTMGDIMFGIMFVAALEEGQLEEDMRAETIDEMGRVLSDVEAYGGTFSPPCEGVVFFVWDNTHDWYSNKKVSYKIELHQVRAYFYISNCNSNCITLTHIYTTTAIIQFCG